MDREYHDQIVETYRLTLTHRINGISVEEPKAYEVHNCNYGYHIIDGSRNHLIDELFYRFREELKKEEEE